MSCLKVLYTVAQTYYSLVPIKVMWEEEKWPDIHCLACVYVYTVVYTAAPTYYSLISRSCGWRRNGLISTACACENYFALKHTAVECGGWTRWTGWTGWTGGWTGWTGWTGWNGQKICLASDSHVSKT